MRHFLMMESGAISQPAALNVRPRLNGINDRLRAGKDALRAAAASSQSGDGRLGGGF